MHLSDTRALMADMVSGRVTLIYLSHSGRKYYPFGTLQESSVAPQFNDDIVNIIVLDDPLTDGKGYPYENR